MRQLICEFCSVRQPYDPRPGAKCLNCGGPVKATRRCFACHEFIPPNPRCTKCKTSTVDLELYPAAVMLAAKGTPIAKVAGRVPMLELGEREALEKEYRNSWMPVDDLLEKHYRLMGERTGPQFVEMSRQQMEQLRKTLSPAALLPVIREGIKTWAGTKPSASPWPHGMSKAILESAPLKLDRLRSRLDRPRGCDEDDRRGLREHVDALNPSMGTLSPAIACLCALGYRHALVFGESSGTHETQPAFDLHEASIGREPVDMAIPVLLFRDRGVLWAHGPRPSHHLGEAWAADGFVYAPFDGAPIALNDIEGLRAFLRAVAMPIEPWTISQVIHCLLSPFPVETRVALEDGKLLDAWHDIEVEHINRMMTNREAAKKLGIDPELRTDRRDELVLRLEPIGTTLVYRPPELEVRGPLPPSRVVPAMRTPTARLPEHSTPEREMMCGNCGVRREWKPGTQANCANCGSPPDAETRCFGCFEMIPPKARCTHCGVPTVPMRQHALALMLRAEGVELGDIPARARSITPPEQSEVEARYRATWKPVDDAIERLRTVLGAGMEPRLVDQMISTVRSRRWNPACSRDETIEYVRQLGGIVKTPAVAPFAAGVCKAIREAGVVRLAFLDGSRGLGASGRQAIEGSLGSHTEDAEFAIGQAYLNLLSYRQLFVWGEVPNRNETKTIFELAEAAKRRVGIPIALIRGRGVLMAQGPPPSAEVKEAWAPTGFVFIAEGGTATALHDVDGLRAFLKEMKPAISPQTLPFLVHVLLAPFPWTSRFEEPTGLIEKWKDGAKPGAFERLLGIGAPKELVLKVDRKTISYRPGTIDIR